MKLELESLLPVTELSKVQFFGVDSRTQDFGVSLADNAEFVGMVQAYGSKPGSALIDELLMNADKNFVADFQASWNLGQGGEAERPHISFEDGAGGFRRFGRLCLDYFVAWNGQVPLVDRINRWRGSLSAAHDKSNALIFCSLSGGTASGITLDLAMALKQLCRAGGNPAGVSNITLVCCLPEIFDAEREDGNRDIDIERVRRNFKAAIEEIRLFSSGAIPWKKQWANVTLEPSTDRPFDNIFLVGSREVDSFGTFNFRRINNAEALIFEIFRKLFVSEEGTGLASNLINSAPMPGDEGKAFRIMHRKIGFDPEICAGYVSLRAEENALIRMRTAPEVDVPSLMNTLENTIREDLDSDKSIAGKLKIDPVANLEKLAKDSWFASPSNNRKHVDPQKLEKRGDLERAINVELSNFQTLQSNADSILEEMVAIYTTAMERFLDSHESMALVSADAPEEFARLGGAFAALNDFLVDKESLIQNDLKEFELRARDSLAHIKSQSKILDDRAFHRNYLFFRSEQAQKTAVSKASQLLADHLSLLYQLEQREAEEQIVQRWRGSLGRREMAYKSVCARLDHRLAELKNEIRMAFRKEQADKVRYRVELVNNASDLREALPDVVALENINRLAVRFYQYLVTPPDTAGSRGRPAMAISSVFSTLKASEPTAVHRNADAILETIEGLHEFMSTELATEYGKFSVVDVLWRLAEKSSENQSEGLRTSAHTKFKNYFTNLTKGVGYLGGFNHTMGSKRAANPQGALLYDFQQISAAVRDQIPGATLVEKDRWILNCIGHAGQFLSLPQGEASSLNLLVAGKFRLDTFSDISEIDLELNPEAYIDRRYVDYLKRADTEGLQKKISMCLLAEWYGVLSGKGGAAMAARKTCGNRYELNKSWQVTGRTVAIARDNCFSALLNDEAAYDELYSRTLRALLDDQSSSFDDIENVFSKTRDHIRGWISRSNNEELRDLLKMQEGILTSILNDAPSGLVEQLGRQLLSQGR
ncbi:MAG: tubulin-like doman-containing protein [Pseudomonadota bacterium]